MAGDTDTSIYLVSSFLCVWLTYQFIGKILLDSEFNYLDIMAGY